MSSLRMWSRVVVSAKFSAMTEKYPSRMYMAKVPALPPPTTPALGLGPPVLRPDGRTMFRVLDHRCHWLPTGR